MKKTLDEKQPFVYIIYYEICKVHILCFERIVEMIQDVKIPKEYYDTLQAKAKNTAAWQAYDNDNLINQPKYNVDDFEFLVRQSEYGARQAMNWLQREAQDGMFDNVPSIDFFKNAKRYFIYSVTKHRTLTELRATMCMCNLERIEGRCVGCLVLGEDTYVFFWHKNA